ncbi:unnamed protein product [Caenorhabditis angaria]|uniref:Conserved oligomeric Golgi complex subunit 4 n=1 Tax=Caenorhabditis angaria TaxID=860376 RepID=A0A9P1IBZ4_9PELO|nr:unnamed protein product [Caenorhabditis angaria]
MPDIKFNSGVPSGRKNKLSRKVLAENQNENEDQNEIFDFSRKIRELRLELEIRKREEERIEKDISIIIEENSGDGGEQNRTFGLAVTRLNNNMLVVENSAKQLTNTLKNISLLADTISGRVSALDEAKNRVVNCLQLAGDMRDLGVCAEGIDEAIRSEDFETASEHIHRFLTLDQAVFQIREFKDKDATDSIRHSYEVLSSAKERLSKILKARLDDAVIKGDVSEMQRFVKLFPLLKESDEGMQRFGKYINTKIDKLADDHITIMRAGGTDDERRNVLYADTLFMFFEGIAGILESNLSIMESSYGSDKILDFLFILQTRIDEFFKRLLVEFDKNRKVSTIIKQINSTLFNKNSIAQENILDPLDIDSIVAEICLMNNSVEMYGRFIGRRVGKQADEEKLDKLLNRSLVGTKMQELIGNYILIEHYYMQKSVEKAINMDLRENEELTSSIVEDTVFIVRKCIRRAAGSGNVDSVCATINNAVAMLETTVHQYLGGFINSGFSTSNFATDAIQTAMNAAYQKPKDSQQDTEKDMFLLALNNSSKMSEMLKELQKGLIYEWSNVSRPAVEKNKLEHAATQIDEIVRKLTSLAKHGIDELFKAGFKGKIKSSCDPYRDISHQLTMQDLEHFEANDPFVEAFLTTVDRLLVEHESLLYSDNYQHLLLTVCSELSRQFELILSKCQFNRYGALQLDREYRQISAYLTNVAGWNAREKCARLGLIVGLLNVETIEEAMENWQNSKTSAITTTTRPLTLGEVKKYLALRVDFPTLAINSLN